MSRWQALKITGFALLMASQSVAQETSPPADDEPTYFSCSGGGGWGPSLSDIRDIATIPVPESFRRRFESADRCVSLVLDDRQLVDWHLGTGNERTVTRALAYLEVGRLRGLPPPDGLARALQRAWPAAGPDLVAARAIPTRYWEPAGARYRFMRASPSIRRLWALLDQLEAHIRLAEHYVRAAEEFGSAALLQRAERLLRPAVDATGYVGPLWRQSPADAALPFNPAASRVEDLQMRVAVLRARLTRSPADVARARQVVQSFERPIYRRAAELAFSGGPQYCDIAADMPGADEVRAACRDDEEFYERVTAYWSNRGLLEFDGGGASPTSMELAIEMLEREEGNSSIPRCCDRSPWEDRRRLLMARADDHARRFGALAAADRVEALRAWSEALSDLEKAHWLVAPYNEPGRFRRIAEAWLSLSDRARQIDPAIVDLPASGHRRVEAYLRHLLSGLDAIAVGAVPPGS